MRIFAPVAQSPLEMKKMDFGNQLLIVKNVQGADYVLANVRYKEHIQVKIKENRKSTQPGLEMTGHG